MHYLIPCWNIPSEKYDFTIGYYDKDQTEGRNCLFKQLKFEIVHVGPFIIVKAVRKYAKKYIAGYSKSYTIRKLMYKVGSVIAYVCLNMGAPFKRGAKDYLNQAPLELAIF